MGIQDRIAGVFASNVHNADIFAACLSSARYRIEIDVSTIADALMRESHFSVLTIALLDRMNLVTSEPLEDLIQRLRRGNPMMGIVNCSGSTFAIDGPYLEIAERENYLTKLDAFLAEIRG